MTPEEREVETYHLAAKIAKAAMGNRAAFEDPLAFECLIHAILNFDKLRKKHFAATEPV